MTPPPETSPTQKNAARRHADDGRADLWLIAALIIIAFFARLPRITDSLWYDEIAAWRDYGARGPAAIVTTYYDPANHIAHTLLSWCAVELLLDSLGQETALRLPALLFSLAAIVPIYGLARHAGSRRIATLAAAIAACAPVAILEAAEARGYSMMIFFSAAASWLLLTAIESRRPWRWLLYAIACALGVWSHLMTVFLPIGHAAWLAWRARIAHERAPTRLAPFALILAAALTLALYAPVLDDLIRIRATFASIEGDEPSPLGTEGLHALWQLGGSWYGLLALPGLLLAALGFITAMRRDAMRRVVAVTTLALPIAFLLLLVARSWIYARFALFAFPGACVLMAMGIDTLWRRRTSLGLLATIILAACFAGDLNLRPPKQPLREAAAYVAERRRPDDRVLIIGLRHEVMDLYAAPLDPTYSLNLGAELADDLSSTDPHWIIMMYPLRVDDAAYELLAHRGFALQQSLDGWADWGHGDLLIFHR